MPLFTFYLKFTNLILLKLARFEPWKKGVRRSMGAGNSLRTALELQANLTAARLIPVVRLLHDDSIKTSARILGL